MKGVKLEDVTGEKAMRKPPERTYTDGTHEPKIDAHEIVDDAANRITRAIIACFGVSLLFLINGVLAVSAGDKLPISFLAAEADSVPTLFIMSLLMAVYGFLALRRSHTALLSVALLYAVQSLWVAWLIHAYGPSVWTSDFSYTWDIGRSIVLRGVLIGIFWSGHEGMKTYHSYQEAGSTQEA